MVAGQLEIVMLANVARLQKDMTQAKGMVGSTMKGIERSVASAKSALGALGIGLGVGFFARMVKGAIDAQDELSKLSQKVGISVETLAGLKHVADLSGISFEGLQKGIKSVSTQMFDASMGLLESKRNFSTLGIEIMKTDGTLKSAEQVIIGVADKFAAMEAGTLKTALAVKLFGKAGLDMIPILDMGSKALAEMVAEGQRLNPVTAESAKQSEIFNDNMSRLGKTFTVVGIKILNDLLPFLSAVATIFAEDALAAGIKNTGKEVDQLDAKFKPLTETLRTVVVLGGNFAFVWRQIGISIAGAGAQIAAFSRGGLKSFMETRAMVNKILLDERAALDEWERKIMEAGTKAAAALTPPRAGAAGGFRPVIVDEVAAKKAAAELSKSQIMVGNQWVEDMEEWNKIMAEVSQLTNDFYQKQREDEKALGDARMKAWFEFIDAQQEMEIVEGQLAAGFDGMGNKIETKLTEMGEFAKEAARGIQRSFSDGLFDIMQGKFDNMGDRFKAVIDRMVADVIAAKLATAMFGDMDKTGELGGWMGTALGALFGSASFATGTDFVPRTGLAMVHRGEKIIPAEKNQGGDRGMNVTNVFNISGQADRRTQAQIAVAAGEGVRRAMARDA